ncbi:MAG: polysaccharide deacetylase family protein [Terracidiphilus sp.]
MTRGGALRVLLYHRFSESCRSALAAQCDFLRDHYTPISLTEAVARLQQREALPANAVAFTVDDGHADYLRVAHECFAKNEIPATVFVVEQFIGGNYWLWFDRLEYAVRETRLTELRIEMGKGKELATIALTTERSRSAAVRRLQLEAKKLPSEEVTPFVRSLEQALEVDCPAIPTPEYTALRWEELKQIADSGTTVIGAHTATHPILCRLKGSSLVEEIGASRHRMEKKLGIPMELFAYPNGQPADISPQVVSAVKAAGFKAAFTTIEGINTRRTDPFLMRRICVRPEFPVSIVADALSGAR